MSTRGQQLGSRHTGAGRPELRVVRRKQTGLMRRSRSRRVARVAVFGAVVAVVLVFGVLLEQVVLAQSAFRLSEIRERLARAERKHEELVHEAALLDNPARIERVAKQRLGMVEPDPAQQKFIVADIDVGDRATRAALGERVPRRLKAAAAAAAEEAAP